MNERFFVIWQKTIIDMTMIYTLGVECILGSHLTEQCIRVIEIAEDDSLFSLHEAIQDAVDFDRDHLFDFYAGRNMRNTKIIYSDWEHRDTMIGDYDSIKLNQVYPLKNLKLYYLFDFGDSWYFEIRKMRGKKEPIPGVKYPRLIESIGPNPLQYPPFE